jgi:hypothetical protein
MTSRGQQQVPPSRTELLWVAALARSQMIYNPLPEHWLVAHKHLMSSLTHVVAADMNSHMHGACCSTVGGGCRLCGPSPLFFS